MSMKIKAAAAVLALVATTVVASQSPAQAACWYPEHHNYSSGDAKVIATSGVNFRTGPSTSCGIKGSWAKGTHVYLHCFIWSEIPPGGVNPNWWYVRKEGTSQEGWVYAEYITEQYYQQGDRCDWKPKPIG